MKVGAVRRVELGMGIKKYSKCEISIMKYVALFTNLKTNENFKTSKCSPSHPALAESSAVSAEALSLPGLRM